MLATIPIRVVLGAAHIRIASAVQSSPEPLSVVSLGIVTGSA
jgi:hypothetical protein